ncbi:sodium:solute symporter family protein [Fulvivirga sediminis]|uniref:Na+:solute symporter n=1 Tax=Fulvivirga sediminis TaxID=2803949 RepID=A0A937F3P7_9BACT|nr:sodium:solute symporter family protein [Fulvivirga sediminis]MBL3655772.1 Na+:solute symporter [Fulvivirga sediminis]
MKLSTLDLLIILGYLLSTIVIGLYLKKRASKNINAYFLGGNTLPWYMLGLSNASGMFDISGTMWMVTLMFVYGLKSIWIPWLWPVFNQIFLMIYLSVWLRRSNVLTGAEWIKTRFGNGKGAHMSHIIVVVFAIFSALGFLSYGFIGIGKFIEIFLPWDSVAPYMPFDLTSEQVPNFYGIVLTSVATFYVVMGGLMSVVWTDVLQFTIMTVSAIVIGIIAMNKVSHDTLMSVVPEGWDSPFFGWQLDLDWTQILPSVNSKIEGDGFSLFTIFFMMMLFKGVFASMAGPAPNFDMQKVLATKKPSDAAKMSGFVSLVLLLPRYFMIAGFTVLALVFFKDDFLAMGNQVDFEKVLPMAISEFVPVGLMGLLLAGLLAAFMSTFASTVNAAPAYLINDIYLKYINPSASRKQLMNYSYLVSFLVVALSTLIGLYIEDINSVLQWIVSALYGGYIAANVLKWHWWRFNGAGYFWGMAAGIIASMVFPVVFPYTLPLYYFPLTLLVSVVGCIVGTFSAPPAEDNVLIEFYRSVRPWGFWRPVHQMVVAKDPGFEKNQHFKRNALNVVVGIIWQTSLTIIPIYIILREELPLLISVIILFITMLILKKNWYDKLDKEDEILEEEIEKGTLDMPQEETVVA